MTPPQKPRHGYDALLDQAVAVARRGPLAKPNRVDRSIVDAAYLFGRRHSEGPQRECRLCIETAGTEP